MTTAKRPVVLSMWRYSWIVGILLVAAGAVSSRAQGTEASSPGSRAKGLEEVLVRLTAISLDEAALREMAGKDRFEPYVLNPVLTTGSETRKEWDAGALGSPCVVKVDGVYHMYYEAWGKLAEEGGHAAYHTLQIGHAVSLDGVHWAKDPANPVVRGGDEGQWTQHGTWDPFVIHEDGLFKMWFGGKHETFGENKDKRCEWGYATSRDGRAFDLHGQISQLGNVEDLHVVHDKRLKEYRLYYWDRTKGPWKEVMQGPPAPSGLVVARGKTETDIDFPHAQVLTIDGQPWPSKYSHVLPHGDGWAMFFGEAVTRGNPSSTGLAFSSDGIHWRKAAFPIVRGHDAEVIEAATDLWLIYYGPDTYFDWPECDIRLGVYEGKLEDLKGLSDRE